jgi:alkyl hydroperoxide reductase subunit AhpC
MCDSIPDDTFTVRSVLSLVRIKGKTNFNLSCTSTGRNFDELLRVIDSLQLTANYSVATPANWKMGMMWLYLLLKDEDIPTKFPKGVQTN